MDRRPTVPEWPKSEAFSIQHSIGEGCRIDVSDGASKDTADLVHIALELSFAWRGKWIRCSGIVPGATMWVTVGELRPMDDGEKLQLVEDIWAVVRPKLVDWLRSRAVAEQLSLRLTHGMWFEFCWGRKLPALPYAAEICVHYDAAYVADYALRRRRQPLRELPASPGQVRRHQFVTIRRLLLAVLDRSRLALDARYSRLPIPVRWRVAGVLAAWQALCDVLDAQATGRTFTTLLTNAPILQVLDHVSALTQTMLPTGTRGQPVEQLVADVRQSVLWYAFELRKGVFYEPSEALHQLLDSARIADDVPIGMVSLPVDTFCILPKAGTVGASTDHAIAFFRNPTGIGFATWSDRHAADRGKVLEFRVLEFPMDEPEVTIREALRRVFVQDDAVPQEHQDLQEQQEQWRAALDYAIKMLLYLKARPAHVIPDRAYTNAPKNIGGLGKRRRAERLEEFAQLYDRFVVGPALLDEELASRSPTHGGNELSTHWRSPYFKMQHYGRRNTQRKLVFVGPTIVRADRLGE